MKRVNLIRHLSAHGCRLLREGRSHSVWINPVTGAQRLNGEGYIRLSVTTPDDRLEEGMRRLEGWSAK